MRESGRVTGDGTVGWTAATELDTVMGVVFVVGHATASKRITSPTNGGPGGPDGSSRIVQGVPLQIGIVVRCGCILIFHEIKTYQQP